MSYKHLTYSKPFSNKVYYSASHSNYFSCMKMIQIVLEILDNLQLYGCHMSPPTIQSYHHWRITSLESSIAEYKLILYLHIHNFYTAFISRNPNSNSNNFNLQDGERVGFCIPLRLSFCLTMIIISLLIELFAEKSYIGSKPISSCFTTRAS